jgi:SAM-dependent methyltransferase
MQILTGGYMLNFGFWDNNVRNPLDAQYALSSLIGKFASLSDANKIMDVGSGYSAPAMHWLSQNNNLKIYCININLQQLKSVANYSDFNLKNKKDINDYESKFSTINNSYKNNITCLNSTSTMLPIKSDSVDRVIAFESAQHFKPLIQFIKESWRVLKQSGFLVIAMPVIINSNRKFSMPVSVKLGILSITWASEHYNLDYVKTIINTSGFTLKDIRLIGSNVYKPLANYYMDNRLQLKDRVIKEYSKFFEIIFYRSLLKMKYVSENGIIDYLILKAQKP